MFAAKPAKQAMDLRRAAPGAAAPARLQPHGTGNQAALRRLAPVARPAVLQRRRADGAAEGGLEREADRAAETVLSTPDLRMSGPAPDLSPGAAAGAASAPIPPGVHTVIAGPGQPLDPATRAFMEPRFGHDFSPVRLHADAAAERSAREVQADAYTVGQNIVFGAGRLAPGTAEGRRLIAHELAHVVQQSGAPPAARLQRQPAADQPAQTAPEMRRIYSFGPTGAGRMQMMAGPRVFDPPAQTDDKGRDLVRAGTPAEPIRSRFGRRFQLDEREQPTPAPVPVCGVRAGTEWTPDDGSAGTKDDKSDPAARYYGPGEPLGTDLGTEYIFPNDRPGVLTLHYTFAVTGATGQSMLFMQHEVHFVTDAAAPQGATVAAEPAKGPAAPTKAAADVPAAPAADKQPTAPAAAKQPAGPAAAGPLPGPRAAPPAGVARANALTQLIKTTADAVKRDPLVKELRDLLVSLQPVMPKADAKKAIDDAIDALVKTGAEKGIMAILQAVTGTAPTAVPPADARGPQLGPTAPRGVPGETIIKAPPIPFDYIPKQPARSSFGYKSDLAKSYAAGAAMTFTVLPPADFATQPGAKRVVIVADADRNATNPDRLGEVKLESASPTKVQLTAPATPGKYVIRVNVGLGFDYASVQDFEVTAPEKK